MYIDSHVHLHAYADPNGLLDRARAAGVVAVVGIPIDLPTSAWTVEFAEGRSDVFAGVGVHPARLLSSISATDMSSLAKLAESPAARWIGEIGLDSVDFQAELGVQIVVFRDQLDLARRLAKPVNLHFQGAVAEGLAILKRDGVPEAGAVYHYFTGDWELAQRALAAGLYLSVGKPVTRSSQVALRKAIARAPLDRLLLETDSYPLPGRETEPADLGLVATAVAELKDVPIETVASTTSANLRHLMT